MGTPNDSSLGVAKLPHLPAIRCACSGRYGRQRARGRRKPPRAARGASDRQTSSRRDSHDPPGYHFDAHVADAETLLHGHRLHRRPGELLNIAHPAFDAQPVDDRPDHALVVHAAGECPLYPICRSLEKLGLP